MQHKTLSQWLAHLETAHSGGLIDMGLTRVSRVRDAMRLYPACPVITVGRTNGKGSVCAFLSRILTEAGYKVGTLTSPHLLRFNERIAVNCEPVSDSEIVAAFERIEAARGSVSLTYFEFNTLAAVDIFSRRKTDVMVLEVGLGGRLDAVNIFDADCAVITSVDLDHQAFLGDTVEQVAYEKAGIFRPRRPAVCGQNPVPDSMARHAAGRAARCWNCRTPRCKAASSSAMPPALCPPSCTCKSGCPCRPKQSAQESAGRKIPPASKPSAGSLKPSLMPHTTPMPPARWQAA